MSRGVSDRPSGSDVAVRLSHEDLAARATAYEDAGQSAASLGGVGVIAGLAVGAALMVLGSNLGWPSYLDPLLFASGWAIALTAAGLSWWRQRRVLRKYQLVCPSCNAPMLTLRRWLPDVSRADLAMSTGMCPECGSRICDRRRRVTRP